MSKNIFENRLMYSLIEDTKFMGNVACTIDEVWETYNRLKDSPQRKVIFGAGSVRKRLVRIYSDIKFECFTDNNCVGEIYNNLRVISMEELKEKYSEALIIISTKKFYMEIFQQLVSEGFEESNIVNIGQAYDKLNHLQYFDLPQLNDGKIQKEVFVDGGCFGGATSIDFAK